MSIQSFQNSLFRMIGVDNFEISSSISEYLFISVL